MTCDVTYHMIFVKVEKWSWNWCWKIVYCVSFISFLFSLFFFLSQQTAFSFFFKNIVYCQSCSMCQLLGTCPSYKSASVSLNLQLLTALTTWRLWISLPSVHKEIRVVYRGVRIPCPFMSFLQSVMPWWLPVSRWGYNYIPH